MLRKLLLTISFISVFILSACSSFYTKDPETLRISLNPGIDTVEVNSDFIDSGASATLEGKDHSVEVIKNNVDITKVGLYEIIYQTTYSDNTLEIKRFVDVIDTTPPLISLIPGIDTIEKNSLWHDYGVSVSDNSNLDVTIVTEGYVTTSQIGEYQITYTAIDAQGNESSIIRYVHVIDN
jgi:hypothetical protein